ncbi:MAG: HAD family hydrolase [Thiotrichales bacterium]
MAPPCRCLLLDLDGTLADTAPDMLNALNEVRTHEGFEPLPMSKVRDHVSHGTNALLKLSFGNNQKESDFSRRRERFLNNYQNALCEETTLFPGMESVLDYIEQNKLKWGVVTNKPGWLTDPLMEALGLATRSATTISADTTAERKPHPLPMKTAAAQAGVEPGQCLYAGDAERDIMAGNAANMQTVVAGWGYIDNGQAPETWSADAIIDYPEKLLDWFTPQPS